MGTPSGELIGSLITQGSHEKKAAFQGRTGAFSILGDTTHPPMLPLLPFRPLLSHFMWLSLLSLEVPPVFFTENIQIKTFL